VSGPVLVLVEHAAGEPDRLSLEALAFASSLAVALGADVEAVLVGHGSAGVAASLGGHGVRTAHVVEDGRLDAYAPAAFASALGTVVEARSPSVVLAPGSDRGTEVLAHLAARTGLPMAANVVSAEPGESSRIVRQRWAGSLLEDATLDAPIRLMTVAPHVVEAADGAAAPAPAVVSHSASLAESDLIVRVTGREAPETGKISLTDAKVVIGGGRGVGSAEQFAVLEELAGLIGAAVGGSRVATSLGWRPHSDQIGQTGLRIAPELYIACGISGAIQHIVGCKAAKRILAINTDPDSPIMAVADYAVIGDLHAVLPAITAEVRRRR
jgi:electron transfer flavoprotein alpha subunit